MKRSILLITVLFLLSSALYASTNVPASLSGNTTWDPSGNPYMIQGKVTVPSGSTLMIEDGVQVIFQGASALEVQGTLRVQGAAAAPAVFNMVEGGLQSELFINGGEADITNAKVVSGVFLVKDSTLILNGSEITKGSGLYLKGSTTAQLKNNKIYGNSLGIALDGTVKATLSFNTIVQNTYGLLVKGYSELEATNNSIHDNQMEIVNSTPPFKLGGNFWGTEDANAVQAKIQGGVDVKPLRSLKDILRVYVRTQLPIITKKMEIALVAKEKKEAREEAALMKRLKAEQATAQKPGAAPPAPEVPAAPAAEQAAAPAPEQPAAEQAAPAAPEAPQEVEAPAPTNKTVAVSPLPAAPHSLKPLANLPPAQNVENVTAASASSETQPAAPAAPAPPATAAAGTESVIPPMPEDITAPPAPGTTASTAPPPPDMNSMAPPPLETTAPPPAPEAAKPATGEAVPAPPDLNEQVPPATAASAVPPPPVGAAANVASPSAPPPPANVEATADQQKAVSQLGGVSGDIDGMQAPPLDLGPDLSNATPPTADQLLGTGQPGTPANGTTAPAAGNNVPNSNNLTLPPLQDKDVAPPKDLDLPPMDDLGNVNLDSRNK